ncbi:hypothetical protein AB1K56_14690 [Microbacterium sp. BWR-S6Y]|uniref:hypothetical protein n=1 Tax=Microbacterium sp. BWR-S6Y TaxID=3232073 RepID=UPI003528FEE3
MLGFLIGALPGVLYVLLGWFPEAVALHTENPHFTDPSTTVCTWIRVYGGIFGTMGAAVGLVVGLVPIGGSRATRAKMTAAARRPECQTLPRS